MIQNIFDDSSYLNDLVEKSEFVEEESSEHRAACHRCGNMRKRVTKCTECPHVFCFKCTDKMISMDGPQAFDGGCPLCKDLCCCGSQKSIECTRTFHCYKKCLRYRSSPRSAQTSSPKNKKNHSVVTFRSQHSSLIDRYLKDDSDSEDGNFFPSSNLPPIHEEDSCDEDVTLTQTSKPGIILSSMRSPVTLAPINTNASFVSPSPVKDGRVNATANSQSSRKSNTPGSTSRGTPKLRRTATHLLSPYLHSQASVDSSPQPPFNDGIPSIFAPQSLTPETSPFFLQSSLPSTHPLPSIRHLLQSELVNPFARGILTPTLHREMESVHIEAPIATPDPAVGYGFTFGNITDYSQNTQTHRSNNTAFRPSTHSTSHHADVIFLEQVNAHSSSIGRTDPHNHNFSKKVATVDLASSTCLTTPNIDRACEYLSRMATEKASLKSSASNQEELNNDKAKKIAKTSHAHDLAQLIRTPQLPVTEPSEFSSHSVKFGAPSQTHSGAFGTQRSSFALNESQSSKTSFSPVSGLFCTPLATEGNISQQLTQRSELDGSNAVYDWSGGTSMHLGVDVLTPAGLPQCTPMTVEPTLQQLQEETGSTSTPVVKVSTMTNDAAQELVVTGNSGEDEQLAEKNGTIGESAGISADASADASASATSDNTRARNDDNVLPPQKHRRGKDSLKLLEESANRSGYETAHRVTRSQASKISH